MTFARLSFDVTSACNLKCAHCLRDDKKKPQHLPLEIVEKVLDQCGRYRTKIIIFTGGEPFLHPEYNTIADMVAKRGLKMLMVTNGTRLDKIASLLENSARRSAIMSISISLDGATEETCDAIRGKGVYRKVMSSSAFLKAKGVPFGYKLSINKKNAGELERYVLDAKKLGADYVEFSHMHPTPDLIRSDLILPREKWRDVDTEIARLQRAVRMTVTVCAGGYCDLPMYQCSSMQMNDVHIDCRGNASICCILPYLDPPRDGNWPSPLAGNMADVDLWDAHKVMVAQIARINQTKIRKIAEETFEERDHYPCIFCFKQFGLLEWLKKMDPENEWIRD